MQKALLKITDQTVSSVQTYCQKKAQGIWLVGDVFFKFPEPILTAMGKVVKGNVELKIIQGKWRQEKSANY